MSGPNYSGPVYGASFGGREIDYNTRAGRSAAYDNLAAFGWLVTAGRNGSHPSYTSLATMRRTVARAGILGRDGTVDVVKYNRWLHRNGYKGSAISYEGAQAVADGESP